MKNVLITIALFTSTLCLGQSPVWINKHIQRVGESVKIEFQSQVQYVSDYKTEVPKWNLSFCIREDSTEVQFRDNNLKTFSNHYHLTKKITEDNVYKLFYSNGVEVVVYAPLLRRVSYSEKPINNKRVFNHFYL